MEIEDANDSRLYTSAEAYVFNQFVSMWYRDVLIELLKDQEVETSFLIVSLNVLNLAVSKAFKLHLIVIAV